MARSPSRGQTARPRPRQPTPDDDDDSQSDNSQPVKQQRKAHHKTSAAARTKVKTTNHRKEESGEEEYTLEKRKGAARGKKEVTEKVRPGKKAESKAGTKRKNGLKGDVSMDSIASVQEEAEEDEGQGERSDTEDEEGDSDETEDAGGGGQGQRVTKGSVKSGRRKSLGRKAKSHKEAEGNTMVIDGKKLSVDQVRAMMALLCKDHPAQVFSNVGSVILDEDGMAEEELEEIDFEGDREGEYGEIAIELEEKLQDHFAAVNEADSELMAEGAANGLGMKATACLEARLGSDLTARYHDWVEAERAFKAASRANWDEMMKPMEANRDKMLTVVGQIEKVAANRTQIIQAARRAYDEKVAEHEEEIDALKAELDRLQKKAAKAYDKFTDESFINKDILMRYQAAIDAYKDKSVTSVRRDGRKKVDKSDVEMSSSEDEDGEEEDEEEEED